MIDRRRDLGFRAKALDDARVGEQLAAQELDREALARVGIDRADDLARRATADRLVRNERPVKLDALEDLVLRLNRLAQDLPEVRSLVLDPVLAGPDGIAVAGVRIVLAPPPTREEAGPRRLT